VNNGGCPADAVCKVRHFGNIELFIFTLHFNVTNTTSLSSGVDNDKQTYMSRILCLYNILYVYASVISLGT